MFFSQSAWGMAPPQGEDAPPGGGGMIWVLLPIILIFYFLVFRPQKKQQEQHRQLISNLKKGNRVITTSGIYGTVVKAEEESVVLAIGEVGGAPAMKKKGSGDNSVQVRFSKSAIANTIQEEKEEQKQSES